MSFTALALVTDLPGVMGKLVPTIGVASLLTVFGYAALRTRSIVHGAALLGLFIPVISYAFVGGEADTHPDAVGGKSDTHLGIVGETRAAVIWVVLLLVWVLVVANLTSHTRSPAASLLHVVRAVRAFWIEK